MIVNSFSSSNANTVAPYAPLGRQPVGQENNDLKSSSLKALEQSAALARNENHRVPDGLPDRENQRPANTDGQAHDAQTDKQKDQRAQSDAKSVQKDQLIKDQVKISTLLALDREVRAHEHAHAAVGGQYAGAPTYQFVKGPDGVNYAVAGEVSISTSSVPNDPEATIRKAQQIRAAANAPANPSGQDRSVAAAATNLENDARIALIDQRNSEVQAREKLAEEQTKAQKAEEAKINVQDEQYRNEQKQELAQQEADAARRSAERVNSFAKADSKTINISRHLVDIGVAKGLPTLGNFLNHRV